MRSLAHQLSTTETSLVRKKRGLFNFNRQISHSLFGILDSDNEEFFNQKISQIGEQSDIMKLAKEQMVVVK
jgi:hypothetical protein